MENTSQQANFLQCCELKATALLKKWTSLLEFFKDFVYKDNHFWENLQKADSEYSRIMAVHETDPSTVRFLVKALLFLKNIKKT